MAIWSDHNHRIISCSKINGDINIIALDDKKIGEVISTVTPIAYVACEYWDAKLV